MSARFTTAATLVLAFSSMLPARAADQTLLGMVMPDAKVLAGVNVAQAKGTPFGLYLLGQIQSHDQDMLQLQQLTGFNPTSDVNEVLAASTGVPQSHTGLVLASGTFYPDKVKAAATSKGAVSEDFKGITILEDPQHTHGLAFVSSSIAVAGDLASVKAAIDRKLGTPSTLPTALSLQVNDLSNSQDAWVVSTVPFSTLKPPAAPPNVPNLAQATAFQAVQQASAGVKFGDNVNFTAQAQADTPANATAMANVIQLLVNLAQMQGTQNPQAAALAQSVVVTTAGQTLNLSLSIPEDQFQQIFTHPKTGPSATPNARRPRGRQM